MNTYAHRTESAQSSLLFRWLIRGFAALICWVLVAPLVIRPQLEIEAEGLKPGPILSWVSPKDSVRSGAYGVMAIESGDTLTFEVAPPKGGGAAPFEFWLYYVRADSPERYDLNGLLDHGRNPGWTSFVQGDGVVYRGTEPTRLVLHDVRGDVVIGYGRTASSGDVHAVRGGMRVDLQSRVERQDSKILAIPASAITASSGRYVWKIPSSRISGLRLELNSNTGSSFAISKANCVRSFGPFQALRTQVKLHRAVPTASNGESNWTSPEGAELFDVELALGFTWVLHIVGISIVLLIFVLGSRLARFGIERWKHIATSKFGPEVVVAVLLLCVHGTIAKTIPISVSGDGIDYLNGADGLANGWDWSRVPDYKVPGLSFVLAGLMKVSSDALVAFGWLNALLACCNGAIAYALVRCRAARSWAIVAALAVGLHPSLITYQTWLLRELPSAFIMSAIGLMIVLIANGGMTRLRAMIWVGAGFGVLCAVGAYLRENFVLLLLLVPTALIISIRAPLRARIAVGLIAAVTAMAIMYPRAASIRAEYGGWSMVSPKLSWNRLLSSWQNRDTKGNDVRVYGFEEWNEFLSRSGQSPISDYQFALGAVQGFRSRTGAAANTANEIEDISKRIVRDARESDGLRFVKSALLSFVNQMGLWNVQAGFRRSQSASSEYYSISLRGMRSESPDNYAMDSRAALLNPQFDSHRPRLERLISASRQSVRFMEDSIWGAFFNEWFYAFRALRPVIAGLFLAGAVVAFRMRDWPLLAIQSIVILFALATAIGTSALADRFAAPFIPLMWCGALIGLYRITKPRDTTTDASR